MTTSPRQTLDRAHLPTRRTTRRRLLPTRPSSSPPRALQRRWRERPRCSAQPLTPGRRGGVVHAIGCRYRGSQSTCPLPSAEPRRLHAQMRDEIRARYWRRDPRGIERARTSVRPADTGVGSGSERTAPPSRPRGWRRARRRQCAPLRVAPAGGRAAGIDPAFARHECALTRWSRRRRC
jgi:hypothetical protein